MGRPKANITSVMIGGEGYDIVHKNEHMPKFVVIADCLSKLEEGKVIYRIVRLDNKQVYGKSYTQLVRARNICDKLVKELMDICKSWVDFSEFQGVGMSSTWDVVQSDWVDNTYENPGQAREDYEQSLESDEDE